MASSTDDSVQRFGARLLRFTHRVLELIVGLLLSFVYRGPPQHVPPISNMLLLETAESLALKVRKGKVKSEDLVESFIARIKEINPIINCVVADRFEEALKEAREVDKFLATTKKSEEEIAIEKPFLGVPFTTKECLEAKDMIFSAGLYARKDVKGTKNADATQCLCDAGAVLLATTNTSELAMWWESHNYVHGRSKNPYDTSRIVGGSSGGEGAVLAAAGSPMGLGSDIGGSIRMPAFFNGIFGHKPSKFIVSNEGQYPFPSDEDHASFLGIGPMCRYATDLVPMMKVIAAKNAHKLDLDSKVNVSKLKVYYAEDDGGSVLVSPVNPEIKAAVKRTVLFLEKAHGVKAQKVNMKIMKHSISIWMAKMKSRKGGKFARELNNSETTPINVWWGLLKWILCMSRHTFIALCTAITENYGVQYGSPHHQKMVALCDELRIQMHDMLGDDGVFIYPTHPTPAPYHNEPLIKPFNFSYSGIFNVLGLPATHCPMGLNSRGLPIGIQVVAGPNQDRLTLAMAVELEKAFGGWVPPSVNV